MVRMLEIYSEWISSTLLLIIITMLYSGSSECFHLIAKACTFNSGLLMQSCCLWRLKSTILVTIVYAKWLTSYVFRYYLTLKIGKLSHQGILYYSNIQSKNFKNRYLILFFTLYSEFWHHIEIVPEFSVSRELKERNRCLHLTRLKKKNGN